MGAQDGLFESFRERLGSLGKEYDDEQLGKIASELRALRELLDVEELRELLGTVDWPAVEASFAKLEDTLLDLQKTPASEAELALARERLASLLDQVDDIAAVVESAHRLMAEVALKHEASRLRNWLAGLRTESNAGMVDCVGKTVTARYADHLKRLDDTNVPAEVVRRFQLACVALIERSGLGSYPSE